MLCVLSHLCPTLCNPMDYNPPGSSVPGILQARILQWVVMPFFGGSSRPRAWTHVSYISCISSQVLYHQPPLQKPKRDARAVKMTFFHSATTILQLKTLRRQEIKQPGQATWLLGHLGKHLKELPAPPPPSCWTLRGLQLVGSLVLLFPLCILSLLDSQGTVFYSKVVERRLWWGQHSTIPLSKGRSSGCWVRPKCYAASKFHPHAVASPAHLSPFNTPPGTSYLIAQNQ